VANGRRKKHHAHELGDPYSEGWDARKVWALHEAAPKPANPYRPAPVEGQPPVACSETRLWEIEQWDLGWSDWEVDAEKGDLAPVTKADFKNLGVRRPPPRREEDD
jgi:hypothetical protein